MNYQASMIPGEEYKKREVELKTLTLHGYQGSAVTQVREAMAAGHKRVVLQVATGGGKTIIAVAIVKSALDKGKKVLFIADRIELIDQTSETFDEYGIPHGIIMADHPRREEWRPFKIASAQTLARRSIEQFDLIVVDEMHSVYKTTNTLMDKQNAYCIGLTATAFTKGLGKNWDTIIGVQSTAQLIDDGFLVPFVAYGPPPPDLTGVKIVRGDYNIDQLGDAVDKPKIVGDVVKTWLKCGDDRQTIVFSVNVAHSKHMVEEFNRYNITASHLDAYTDREERREIIRKFKVGEIKILSSCGILSKGFNATIAACAVLARPTKSRALYLQQVGRVLRTHKGKDNAIILDMAGNITRHGFPDDEVPVHLDDGKKSEAGDKKEFKEREPKPCPSCDFLTDGTFPCQMCGHTPERQNAVAHEDGELSKLERVTTGEKREWFAMLLHVANDKGYSEGWAAHKFKEKFKAWPHKKSGILAVEPSQEVLSFLKYLNIKNAKKKELPKSCRYCQSANVSVRAEAGKKQLRCNSCDKHLKWL